MDDINRTFHAIMTWSWTVDELAYMVAVQQQARQDEADSMWQPGWENDSGLPWLCHTDPP